MRVAFPVMTGEDMSLVGRGEERSRLKNLVAPPYTTSRMLALLGDPGMGKTRLLAEAVREAALAGARILSAAGWESEQDFAFAGLHQLLRPVLDHVDALPPRQAAALRGAFALSEDPASPDVMLTGMALLTLLSGLADHAPLLVAIDDAQWLDRASLDALAFVARRLDAEQVTLLLAAREAEPPAAFELDLLEPLRLAPLSQRESRQLLDEQPCPPRGRAREQVLAQAAGNPLGLIELSKVIADDPTAGRRWAAEPLPLTGRLTAVMADRFTALPAETRAALLLAATADSPDAAAAAVPRLSDRVLAPAEAAGLITLDVPGPRFTHPLVQAAVYHAAPFAERAAAHRKVAGALRDQPDRYARHLAAATLEPDEHVAAMLEESAAQAQRRGGAAAAARALERAAELSPGERDKVRRLLAAAELALPAGQTDWVRELAGRVLTLTSDPDLHTAAQLHIGWSLLWSGRTAEALETLQAVVAETAQRLPAIAWQAAGMTATVAHQTGLPVARARARATLEALDALDGPVPSAEDRQSAADDEQRIWIKACTDPFGKRGETVPHLRQVANGSPGDLGKVGGAAWLLDETQLAVRLLREALNRLRAPGVRGASGCVLWGLAWACIDNGRWDEAMDAAHEATEIAAAYKMETVGCSADLATATILAMRGDYERVGPLLARVLTAVDPSEYRGFAARAWHAAGLAALAQGNYAAAFAQLSKLFAADGLPLHHYFSYLAIADLAAAAVRAERRPEARTLVEQALTLLDPAPGPRLEQLAARARGLLAESADAGTYFAAATSEPAGDTWPFERAQLWLDYGEWLRRQRRINDAKPVLATALETFRNLGAAPWIQRTESELRACGVTDQTPSPGPGALDELTPQQREIVILAGHGLTNGEIANKLFLSSRTVASHLYKSYPKLGVAGRHQLRDLIDQAVTA